LLDEALPFELAVKLQKKTFQSPQRADFLWGIFIRFFQKKRCERFITLETVYKKLNLLFLLLPCGFTRISKCGL